MKHAKTRVIESLYGRHLSVGPRHTEYTIVRSFTGNRIELQPVR